MSLKAGQMKVEKSEKKKFIPLDSKKNLTGQKRYTEALTRAVF
jgi:hypothetical protein